MSEPLPGRLPEGVLMQEGVDHRVRWTPGERLHQLFEQRCDRIVEEGRPEALAVDGSGGRWTYPALDALANRLARHLRSVGHGPGDTVALLLDKSVWSYAAMLAVSKIHAAYVPLDPGFPADRIAFIVEDAQVVRILSRRAYLDLLGPSAVPVLCIEDLEAALEALPGNRIDAQELGPPAGELCYIIYTSGSTGRPKGVPIDHGQIVNFIRVAAEVYGYQPEDRVYQGLTLAFDFAVEEIWVPLVVGATLVPNQTGSSLLGQDLGHFLEQHQITALCCVPTLLATLEQELPRLRLLIVSGEACPRDLVTRWHRPGRRFLNAYGPTEATVTATLGQPAPGRPVTIGRPLPTYAILVLDPHEARVLPAGMEGEIAIAGIGIARGYLNRDEQTRKVFLPDFVGVPENLSGRIYRTGDLGRVNPDGEVEYLGRIDTQVKIRGYRIELSEIESQLMQRPEIAQAVVNTWSPSPGHLELVAYYTQHPDTTPVAADALVEDLRRTLPAYMVPAYYEPLEAIPMLASDKADRKALPPPSQSRAHRAGRAPVEPQGEHETLIAAEVAELLGLAQVSVVDHFFDDLGANSLLMAQLASRLRRRLGHASLSMRDLYDHASVRGLARHIEHHAEAGARPRRPAQAPYQAPRAAWLACGAAQAALAFLFVWGHAYASWTTVQWVEAASGWGQALERAVLGGTAYAVAAAVLPIALKWLLVGRWTAQEFPVWSLRYLRFWIVKSLVRTNPLVAFVGTPLYVAYLRALGARVAWSAVLSPHQPPICTDLLEVGERVVVGQHSLIPGYQCVGGRIRIGPVQLESDSVVGDGAMLDIDTRLGRGSQLAHASCLHAGQHIAPGCRVHGSPAQPAPAHPLPEDLARAEPVSTTRRLAYTAWQLAAVGLVVAPAPLLLAHALAGGPEPALDRLSALDAMGFAGLAYLGSVLGGLALVLVLPRLLSHLIQPGRTYRLYGWHDLIHRQVRLLSNSKFYNELFGDSSFIVHYLRALGYRMPGLVQTGSNFGLSQQHDDPRLCEFGSGTMVSDGLSMLNASYSAHAFRLDPVRLGAQSFLGNQLHVPAGHRVGDDCLIATKAMVPVDGAMRTHTGLLGSPAFEIPRSVQRDRQFDHLKDPKVLPERLRLKRHSNLVTMAFHLVSQGGLVSLLALGWQAGWPWGQAHGALFLAVFSFASLPFSLLYFAAVDWLSRGGRPLVPRYCSIYDPAFWQHERHWKLGLSNDHPVMNALSGTPFKPWAWRLLGVRVGRQVFDDGCSISEKTLTSIGDHVTLGLQSTLQGHALEDGSFKSGPIRLDDGCSVGTYTYVHHDVRIDAGAEVGCDSFVMKGEHLAAETVWAGNPARLLTDAAPALGGPGPMAAPTFATSITQGQRDTVAL